MKHDTQRATETKIEMDANVTGTSKKGEHHGGGVVAVQYLDLGHPACTLSRSDGHRTALWLGKAYLLHNWNTIPLIRLGCGASGE